MLLSQFRFIFGSSFLENTLVGRILPRKVPFVNLDYDLLGDPRNFFGVAKYDLGKFHGQFVK